MQHITTLLRIFFSSFNTFCEVLVDFPRWISDVLSKFRINLVSFRTFRRPLFCKPVSWQGLFCHFLQQTGSNAKHYNLTNCFVNQKFKTFLAPLCLEKKTTEQHARHTFCFFFTMDFRYFRQVRHEKERAFSFLMLGKIALDAQNFQL